jgi:hypothetical protein
MRARLSSSRDKGIHLREMQDQQPKIYDWIFRASPLEMPIDDSEWILGRQQELAAEAPVESDVQIRAAATSRLRQPRQP